MNKCKCALKGAIVALAGAVLFLFLIWGLPYLFYQTLGFIGIIVYLILVIAAFGALVAIHDEKKRNG